MALSARLPSSRVVAARTAIRRQRVVSVSARKTFAKAGTAKSTARYICLDCGWVYDGSDGPFEKLPGSYRCPVCNVPKRRFVKEEAKSGPKGAAMRKGAGDGKIDEGDKSFFLVAAVGGAVLLAGLYFFLNSQVA